MAGCTAATGGGALGWTGAGAASVTGRGAVIDGEDAPGKGAAAGPGAADEAEAIGAVTSERAATGGTL